MDQDDATLTGARHAEQPRRPGLRTLVKPAFSAASLCLVSPLIAIEWIARRIVGTDGMFVSLGCALSLIPGRVGSYLRVGYYRGTLTHMAPDAQIGFGSFFSKQRAEVGRLVRIGAYCILGEVRLGDEVTLASRISVTSGRRQHGDGARGITLGASTFSPVAVGPRTWVGEGAIIMADVGADAIIGAGSVVVRPIPDGATAVGNPARMRGDSADKGTPAS